MGEHQGDATAFSSPLLLFIYFLGSRGRGLLVWLLRLPQPGAAVLSGSSGLPSLLPFFLFFFPLQDKKKTNFFSFFFSCP